MATRRTAKPKGRAKAKGPTAASLIALAEEMNELMELDPAIDVDTEDVEDLKVDIMNNCYDGEDDCQVFSTDEFSDEGWKLLESLGVEAVSPPEEEEEEEEEAPKKKPAAKKKAPAKKAPAKKAAPKKKAPPEEEEEEPEEEEEEEEAPKKKPAAKKKAPAKKDAAKSRFTRSEAFALSVAAFEGAVPLDELAQEADNIYCEKTGKESNLRESKWMQTHGIGILVNLGLAEVVDGEFFYKG